VSLPLGPKHELERLIELAQSQGKQTLAARCLAALAYIEELEAELAAIRQGQQRGGFARAQAMSPERRRALAVNAAKCRHGARREPDGLPLMPTSTQA
jgi:hypothetical protein